MTTHDDLLHAAALAQAEHPGELEYLFAEKMLAAAEPIIRADERERILSELEGPARESEAMYAHAEAVAARLVEVVCEQDDLIQIVGVDATNHRAAAADMRRERDAARAEVERLRSPEWEAEVRADERERIAQAIEEFHAAECGPPESPWPHVCTCVTAAAIARGEVLL